jgi:glucokinase
MEIGMKYIIGIDLGGMSAKAGLFTEAGELLVTDSVETFAGDGFKGTAEKIAQVAKSVAAKGKADFADVLAIGVASPGVVNSQTGVVI